MLVGISYSYSQSIEKGTGMTYTRGVPTHVPRIKFDAEINMDINTGRLYQWSPPVNQWRLMARGIDIGNFNGAPTYVPSYGQSNFVTNNQKQIYYYSGNVWTCLTCAASFVGAYNGLTRLSDSIVLGGTLDRNTTIRGVSAYPLIFDSLSTFRVTTRATLGNSYNVISSIPFLNNGITLSTENVLDPNISTSLNVRAQNESQLASRNTTKQAYFRLTPTSAYLGSGLVANPSSDKQFRIENDSFLFINMEYAPAKSNDFLVIRPDGSVFKDSSSYLQTLSLNGDTLFISGANYVILSGLSGAGNGIYGGSGTTPTITVATVDSILKFESTDSKSQIQIRTTNSLGLYGSDLLSTPDSVRLSYFDLGGDSKIILNQDGVLLKTSSPDRLIIQGADTRYAADYRSTYSDRSLIDKKYGDDFYLQEIDSFRINNDTLFISLTRDSVPEKFVVLPQSSSTDTSGYNFSFTSSNDSLFITDGAGTLFVKLPQFSGTDTSGYNLDFYISNDSIFIRDGSSTLYAVLPPQGTLYYAGPGISITGDTIINTGDTSIVNEGKLGVSNYISNTAKIISNTPVGSGVIISGGTGIQVSVMQSSLDSGEIRISNNATLRVLSGSPTTSIVETNSDVGKGIVFEAGAGITLTEKAGILGGDTIKIESIAGLDTSGYNTSFIRSNDTLYLTDGNGTLFTVLPSGGITTLSGEVNGLTTATKVDTVSRIFFKSTGGGIDSTYKLTYNPAEYTLNFGMGVGNASYQMGQEMYYPPVINKTAVTIKNGQPVMIDTLVPIQGDKLRVIPAVGTNFPAHYVVGVATHDILPDGEGLVSWFGYVRDVKESDVAATGVTLDIGDILYISTEAGKYTDTEPPAPLLNSTIAIVVRKPNSNNLTLLVRPWLNENLDDLRNVNTSGITDGQSLKWNTSTKTWTPQSYIPSVGATTGQIIKWDGASWIATSYNTYQILNTTQSILPSVNQVFVNSLTSSINLTLPTCNSLADGAKFEFVKVGSDNFGAFVVPSSGQTFFDSTNSKSLFAAGNSLTCTCRWDGTTGKWIHKW